MYGAGEIMHWTRESMRLRREQEDAETQAEFKALEELFNPHEVVEAALEWEDMKGVVDDEIYD